MARFKTDRRGIGKIIITGELGERYHATVMDSTGYIDRLEFPGPEDRGVMIHARYDVHGEKNYETSDVIHIRVTADTASISRSLRLYLHNKSEIYHSQAISDTVSYCVLRMSPLTPGIHSAVVADTSGHVYSERVFMVFPTGAGLSVSTDKSSYGKRDKVTCVVSLPGGEDFENGSYSVSVTDKELIPYEGKEDIRSYLYLRSELQGYIENPGYYFDTTRSLRARTESVDSLLQTQGWRYYDLPAISAGQIPRPYFGREYRQTLFGKVSGLFRTARHVTVSFLAPSIQFAAMGQVDSGYFVLKDIDFPEGTSFIVSAVGKDGRSRRYAPILQEDYFAPLYEYPAEREPVIYGNDYKEVSVKRYYDSDNCQMMFDIKPIIVKANRLSIIPKNSPSVIPNYPLRKEWYRDTFHIKPYAKSYDIKSFAAATYPGVRYEVGGYITGPYVSAASKMSIGERRTKVICYLNGALIDQAELDGIPLKDVESMAYISGISAAPFQTGADFFGYPKPVLMIRTKPSYRNISPGNVTAGTPLGWQKPVRFYSPKYDAESSQGAGKESIDNRLTVYWNPNLVFDSDGKSEFSFYTTDSGNEYRIVIEGVNGPHSYHVYEGNIWTNK